MKWIDWIALFLVVAALVVGTYERNKIWGNEISLWSDCVQKSPNKGRPYTNLGSSLLRANRIGDAKVALLKAVENMSEYKMETFTNLGIVYGEERNYPLAYTYFQEALKDKKYGILNGLLESKVYNNWGLYKYYEGDYETSIKMFQECLKKNSNSELARTNFQRVAKARMEAELKERFK